MGQAVITIKEEPVPLGLQIRMSLTSDAIPEEKLSLQEIISNAALKTSQLDLELITTKKMLCELWSTYHHRVHETLAH